MFSKKAVEDDRLVPPYGSVSTKDTLTPTLDIPTKTGGNTDDTASSSSSFCCSFDYSHEVIGASLNFVNGIVGAGCIGYGGAIASSGGFISFLSVLFFAYMTKLSIDLIIYLSIRSNTNVRRESRAGDDRLSSRRRRSSMSSSSSSSTFEGLGRMAYGRTGAAIVGVSKFFFSFGCLLTYIIIVKENFAPTLKHIMGLDSSNTPPILRWLLDDNVTAVILSTTVILPLTLLRDLTPLKNFSLLKIMALISIAIILFVLFLTQTEWDGSSDIDGIETVPPTNDGVDSGIVPSTSQFHSRWIEIRPGFIENIGTFVFTFTSGHMIHLVFFSLKLQTLTEWKKISFLSIILSMALVLLIGLFPYMTFWEETNTDLFLLYPPTILVDGARLLLSLAMVLTYPMPFFSCRELLVEGLPTPLWWSSTTAAATTPTTGASDPIVADERAELIRAADGRSEKGGCDTIPGRDNHGDSNEADSHVVMTVTLWAITVILALIAPSVNDVMDLVGCVAGTMISFILPGLFAVRLEGRCSYTAAFLLVVGGMVGSIGTYYSLLNLISAD